ncbi:threonine dehydratase [Aliikangiella maris]|uniref:Threonine dehydratase n=2 Tax=Aliikangiella maris TaxID=3162458 RepID=A0ABV2BZA1_9GAMM
MFTLDQLKNTASLIYKTMSPTPQYNWPQISSSTGCEVWVKHENHTPTTAFKVRGGINLVNKLANQAEKVKGIISATRGNHGQSLAFAGALHNIPVMIVVPEDNSEDQNRAIKSYGAELIIHGNDYEEARQYAAKLEQESGFLYIPPFMPELVEGVATYALEFLTAIQDMDTVYVPIGMGTGICGMIKTRDLLGSSTKIVGVVAEGAPAFALSYEAGKVVTTPHANTMADGVATRTPMEEAFDIIKSGVDRIVVVNDHQISEAMYEFYQGTHNLVEGAGALPLAALNKEKEQMAGKKVGLICSGGNVGFNRFCSYVMPFC